MPAPEWKIWRVRRLQINIIPGRRINQPEPGSLLVLLQGEAGGGEEEAQTAAIAQWGLRSTERPGAGQRARRSPRGGEGRASAPSLRRTSGRGQRGDSRGRAWHRPVRERGAGRPRARTGSARRAAPRSRARRHPTPPPGGRALWPAGRTGCARPRSRGGGAGLAQRRLLVHPVTRRLCLRCPPARHAHPRPVPPRPAAAEAPARVGCALTARASGKPRPVPPGGREAPWGAGFRLRPPTAGCLGLSERCAVAPRGVCGRRLSSPAPRKTRLPHTAESSGWGSGLDTGQACTAAVLPESRSVSLGARPKAGGGGVSGGRVAHRCAPGRRDLGPPAGSGVSTPSRVAPRPALGSEDVVQ